MTKSTILKLFENKLSIESYIILTSIQQNKEDFLSLLAFSKIGGIVNLLQRKNYLDEDLNLNENGEKLLAAIGDNQISQEVPKTNDFSTFVINLHKKLQDKLFEITGKKQIMGFGNVYFIPGVQDLSTFLTRWNKEYKISLQDNSERIEKILVSHVEKCGKAKKYIPAVKYFIIKEKVGSQLTAALENYEEESKTEELEDNAVNI